LRPQRLAEFRFVRTKRAKVNLIAARNIFGQVFDLHLQLRLADLLVTAFSCDSLNELRSLAVLSRASQPHLRELLAVTKS